jgi:hypothetical protein
MEIGFRRARARLAIQFKKLTFSRLLGPVLPQSATFFGLLEVLDSSSQLKRVGVLKVFFQKQLRKRKSDGNWVQESSGKVSDPIQKNEIFKFQISNFPLLSSADVSAKIDEY